MNTGCLNWNEFTAIVATRPRARRAASTLPAMSTCAMIQPPKMSPCWLASAGIGTTRSTGSLFSGSLVTVQCYRERYSAASMRAAIMAGVARGEFARLRGVFPLFRERPERGRVIGVRHFRRNAQARAETHQAPHDEKLLELGRQEQHRLSCEQRLRGHLVAPVAHDGMRLRKHLRPRHRFRRESYRAPVVFFPELRVDAAAEHERRGLRRRDRREQGIESLEIRIEVGEEAR